MRSHVVIAAVALGALGGCFIGAGSFAGKGCDSNNDCPEPYVCAQVRGTGRSCELVHAIDIGGTSGTGGGGGGVNVDPDYCHDAKPILDRTCVSNCHGTDNSGGGGNTFRLDQYTGPTGGAFEKALRVKARVTVDDMPPPGPANPRPTAAERSLVIRWVNTGAAKCRDSGDGGTDGGADGGSTGDGGTKDGGDGG